MFADKVIAYLPQVICKKNGTCKSCSNSFLGDIFTVLMSPTMASWKVLQGKNHNFNDVSHLSHLPLPLTKMSTVMHGNIC